MPATIANQLFDGFFAECQIDNTLEEFKVPYEKIGWDHYDNSLEIHGVAPEWRPTDELQRIFYDWGFGTVYINHTDKWETHYNYNRQLEEFKLSKGWRVSYPHKRGENEKGIWLEEKVEGWPKDWFENGYCIIKPATANK